jgi:hypothetical protein
MARRRGACIGHFRGAVTMSSSRVQRRSGPLTGGATLAGRGKIFPSSMRRARGWCWTRWQEEGLTAMELMWTLVGGGDLRVDLRHRVVKSKVRWGPKRKQWRCKQSSPGGWVGGSATAKSDGVGRAPVSWSGQEAEGEGEGCWRCWWRRKVGEEKKGAAVGNTHFNLGVAGGTGGGCRRWAPLSERGRGPLARCRLWTAPLGRSWPDSGRRGWRSVASANRGEAGADRWAPTAVPGGAGLNPVWIHSNDFKLIWSNPNLFLSKWVLPELRMFEIKYGFEDLKKMNNFLHRNFFKFGRDCEWKFRAVSRFIIQYNLI